MGSSLDDKIILQQIKFDAVYLEDEKTQASTDISTNIDTQFIQGVANIRDDMVILLDVDHLLSEQELVQLNN